MTSNYRLRQGHHEKRNLWEHHTDEPPESKSGQCVGRVDSADLAAEIVNAVNNARANHDAVNIRSHPWSREGAPSFRSGVNRALEDLPE
jgi:hypothetical protein